MQPASWAAVVGQMAAPVPVDRTREPEGAVRPPPPPLDPRAARRRALLAEALRSRADAVTGARGCLACGRAFADLPRLAQHVTDAHGGANAPPAAGPPLPRGAVSSGLMLGDVAVLQHARRDKAVFASKSRAAPPRAAGAAPARFAAPEGTHAKRRKRPSRLKRTFRKAAAQEAAARWHEALAAIEEALAAAREAADAAENTAAALEAQAEPGAAPSVELALLKAQALDGRQRQEQLLSAHAEARRLLAQVQAALVPRALPGAPQLGRVPVEDAAAPGAAEGPRSTSSSKPGSAPACSDDKILSEAGRPNLICGSAFDASSSASSASSGPVTLQNVLAVWASQAGAPQRILSSTPLPLATYVLAEPTHRADVATSAAAPSPSEEAATAADSDSSSAGGSDDLSSLRWGDALRDWALAAGAEARAELRQQARGASDRQGCAAAPEPAEVVLDAPPAEGSAAEAAGDLQGAEVDKTSVLLAPLALADVGAWLEAASHAEPPPQPAAILDAELGEALRVADAAPSRPLRPGEQFCAACGVVVGGARNWDEHVASRRHVARVCVADGLPAALGAPAAPPPRRYVGPASDAAPYVDHAITAELNAAVEALLQRLLEWQARAARLDPGNARRKRRLASGMREVLKAVRARRAKALVVAPNVAAVRSGEEAEAGYPVTPLLEAARAAGVPVIFALSRARLGRLLGPRKSASAFAVLDASGADAELLAAAALADAGRCVE
jgi:ribosomal protein L7Ae-like RNA K-turn-binding protein